MAFKKLDDVEFFRPLVLCYVDIVIILIIIDHVYSVLTTWQAFSKQLSIL